MSQPSEHIPSDTMVRSSFTLRRYTPDDEAEAIELWRRTWQLAYPQIDFNDRVDWWRQRWRDELVPGATITVAEADGPTMATFSPRRTSNDTPSSTRLADRVG